MNYSKQVFAMLGIKPDEEFMIMPSKEIMRIDKNLVTYKKADNGKWYATDFSGTMLNYILLGIGKIRKLRQKITLTKEEQIAIAYARICGFKWLAKDEGGRVFGYVKKPHKTENKWTATEEIDWINVMQMHMPISFLSWEDDEPYYIGGESE